MKDWCILRTHGRATLRLAESLSKAGLEAWTPKRTLERRVPRSRVKREETVPIVPSFVFANCRHLDQLMRLSERPGHHESFSIFRYFGRIPLLADRDLEPLRIAERQVISPRRRRVYRPGQLVRVPEGSFGGMSGIVERSDGNYTLVCFGGAVRVKISTFLLVPDEADNGQLSHSTAAQAA